MGRRNQFLVEKVAKKTRESNQDQRYGFKK